MLVPGVSRVYAKKYLLLDKLASSGLDVEAQAKISQLVGILGRITASASYRAVPLPDPRSRCSADLGKPPTADVGCSKSSPMDLWQGLECGLNLHSTAQSERTEQNLFVSYI